MRSGGRRAPVGSSVPSQSLELARTPSSATVSLAVAVSLLAALVHATVDFVWYVPAYAATLAVLAGLIRSLAHKSEWAKERGGEEGSGDVTGSCSRPLAP